MKKVLLTSALVLGMAAPAFAGAYSEPVIEPEIIVEDTVSSAHDILVPIMALIMFAAVAD
ncbi:hypothetical protein [Rhodovulum adriaticum]|uniref:Uncharacterized protein n=1 Tax=Rhodovulum adriaticum TaxID=35804 RepID=A0A4R2NUR5_RHOAD|nr:hypothetical protein [Rhodovulum adriaticum]MBK1635087.1 hypothetical protein [Rhodovulum adriaticum]TCP25278.1 hypothetical protein EV656_10327 [Rhodovulum adriaticum]